MNWKQKIKCKLGFHFWYKYKKEKAKTNLFFPKYFYRAVYKCWYCEKIKYDYSITLFVPKNPDKFNWEADEDEN